jgi:hypothetical protein
VHRNSESQWYRKTDGYRYFGASYEGIENILTEVAKPIE